MLVDHSLHEQKLPEEIPYKHLLTAVTIRLENLFPQSKNIRVISQIVVAKETACDEQLDKLRGRNTIVSNTTSLRRRYREEMYA
jgi:hypothetical protein